MLINNLENNGWSKLKYVSQNKELFGTGVNMQAMVNC
jgi:hypothetical protein